MKDGHHWAQIPTWEQLPIEQARCSLSVFTPAHPSGFVSIAPVDRYKAVNVRAMLSRDLGPRGRSYDWFACASQHVVQCQAYLF